MENSEVASRVLPLTMHIYVHLVDKPTLTIKYHPMDESAFQALERVYRNREDSFMVFEVTHITFEKGD